MPNFESDSVIYEHPLSERTRAMLRIEFFFHRSDSQILAVDLSYLSQNFLQTAILDVRVGAQRFQNGGLSFELLK